MGRANGYHDNKHDEVPYASQHVVSNPTIVGVLQNSPAHLPHGNKIEDEANCGPQTTSGLKISTL